MLPARQKLHRSYNVHAELKAKNKLLPHTQTGMNASSVNEFQDKQTYIHRPLPGSSSGLPSGQAHAGKNKLKL